MTSGLAAILFGQPDHIYFIYDDKTNQRVKRVFNYYDENKAVLMLELTFNMSRKLIAINGKTRDKCSKL